jgi:hypothetical protein
VWGGFIKDYDGAHLMECYVHPTINYLDVPGMLERQREYIRSRVKQVGQWDMEPKDGCSSSGYLAGRWWTLFWSVGARWSFPAMRSRLGSEGLGRSV